LCQWHEVLGFCRECAIHGDQGVGLEFGEGKVLRVVRRLPVLLARSSRRYGDYLMPGTDLETLGDEVYEGGGVR
jgi:hypothetical protein